MSEQAKPRRRVEITLKLGADSWEDAARAFNQMSLDIDRGNLRGPNACSGGYDYGYTYEAVEDEAITHDSWYADLRAYLETERATPETTGEPE